MRRGLVVLSLLALVSCGGGGGSPTSPSQQAFHQTMTGTVGVLEYNVHSLNIPRGGNMTLTLSWNQSADLDLYLTSTSCNGYPPLDCAILTKSNNSTGATRETITRTVQASESFKLWVDNFSSTTVNYTLDLTVQ
jgi:hypothetical protein